MSINFNDHDITTSGNLTANSGNFISLNINNTSISGIFAPLSGSLNQFATTSSSQLASVISDETGSGFLVFSNSPILTGTPLVPTASSGTNTNQIASTSFVRTEISNLVNSAPSTLDTLNELAAALGNDSNFSTTVTNSLANKANLSGSSFTGSVSAPTGNFTILQQNGTNVSISGHTHTGNDILIEYDDYNNTTLYKGSDAAKFLQQLNWDGIGDAIDIVGGISTDQINNFNSTVSGLLPTIANSGDNRVLTSTGSTVGINAESNLTFNGNLLNVTGSGNFSSGLVISNQTASTIASFDSNKNVVSLSTATYPSLTELSYVKGVTSAIQTQIDSKAATSTTVTAGSGLAGGGSLAANRTIDVGQGDGISVSADSIAVDSTVVRTTGVQTISGSRTYTAAVVFSSGVTVSGNFTMPNQTASTIAGYDANKNVSSLSTSTYPSLTELSYVKGVTSAIQTQLNAKASTSHSHTTSDISNFNSAVSGLLPTIANSGNNRILTSDGTATGINAESNLIFNDETLFIGDYTGDTGGKIVLYNGNAGDGLPSITFIDNNGNHNFKIYMDDSDNKNYIKADNDHDLIISGSNNNSITLDNFNGKINIVSSGVTISSSGTNVPLTITNDGTGNSFVVNDVTGDTTPFVIDSSGNVGIGTTTPTFVNNTYSGLHIHAATATSLKLTNTTTGQTSTDGFELLQDSAGNAYIWNRESTNISIGTSGTSCIIITSAGNVGIGTSTPSATLHLVGSGLFTAGLNLSNQTASTIASFDSSKNIISLSTVTYPSLTELSYVKGVTSAIQTQIDSKSSSTHVHGNITNAGAIGSTANLPLITTTGGVITVGSFGTAVNTFCQGNDSRLSDSRAPTGAAGGDLTGTYPNPTLTNTTVVAGTYKSVTVDAKGRITGGTNPTTISGYGITDVGNGTLTLNVSGTGLSGSASFTANQSGNTTFTVTSNATSANTASAIVARDASGNFSAGTITATLSGNASTTSQTNFTSLTVNSNTVLHAGNYNSYSPTLTGTGASGTWGISISGGLTATIPTLGYTLSTATISYGGQAGPQILGQGGSGSIISFHRPGAYAVNFGLDTDNVLKVGGWSMGAVAYPILHSNNYNSYAPTLTGTGASGTWGINITGSSGSTSQTNFSNLTINSSQVLSAGNYNSYAPTLTGGNASGTWGINITGSSGSTSQTNFTSLTVNTNTVLHAGNYNSYSPTLTGGNASGTWGINITGSSASTSQTNFNTLTLSTSQVLSVGNYATNAPVSSRNFRAWGYYNGSAANPIPAIDGLNVSTASRTANGTYTVTLGVTLSNSDYAVFCSSGVGSTVVTSRSTTTVGILTQTTAAVLTNTFFTIGIVDTI